MDAAIDRTAAIDGAAVRQSIIEVKQALAITYPDKKALINDHPTWPLIEAMALDPTYSTRERSILLANPLHLSPSHLAFRKELIRAFRDQSLSPPLHDGTSSPPILLQHHGPPPNSTDEGEHQTDYLDSAPRHRTRFPG